MRIFNSKSLLQLSGFKFLKAVQSILDGKALYRTTKHKIINFKPEDTDVTKNVLCEACSAQSKISS